MASIPKLTDRFREAPPVRQLAVVGAGAVLVVLLLSAVWFLFLRPDYQEIFTGLEEADAATIVAELEKEKIPFRLAEGGSAILVPAEQADAIRLRIITTDLPLTGTVGFELFNESDMGMTDFAQKINYQRALQGELARTIKTIEGVETVRVHLALGENRVFRDDRIPPKASVIVHMENGATAAGAVAVGIQRLVAAAVNRLDPGQVVVLDESGQIVSASTTMQAGAEDLSPLVQERLSIEQYYRARIRRALEDAFSGADIGVGVHVIGRTSAVSAPWNPAARDFGLEVTLEREDVQPSDEHRVRAVASKAIGYDELLSDTIILGTLPDVSHTGPALQGRARGSAGPLDSALDAQHQDGDAGWLAWVLILSLAVAGLGAVLYRRTRVLRSTDNDARIAFADRLSMLLREEEARNAGARR